MVIDLEITILVLIKKYLLLCAPSIKICKNVLHMLTANFDMIILFCMWDGMGVIGIL